MPTLLRASLLVDTGWLAGHLDDGALRVVDMRGLIRPPSAPKPWYLSKRAAYLESHVPGAVFVDWTEDIVANFAGSWYEWERDPANPVETG